MDLGYDKRNIVIIRVIDLIRKELKNMINEVIGLCTVKQSGLEKILSIHPKFNSPAVRRHIKNPNTKMEYATAEYLESITGVPINQIIEIPNNFKEN